MRLMFKSVPKPPLDTSDNNTVHILLFKQLLQTGTVDVTTVALCNDASNSLRYLPTRSSNNCDL